MKKALAIIGLIIGIIALVTVGVLVESWVLMTLVNWVLHLFGVAFALTFKQALGVSLLLSLIGGFFKSRASKG